MKTLKFEVEITFENQPQNFTRSQIKQVVHNIEQALFNQVHSNNTQLSPDDSHATTHSYYVTPSINNFE